MNAAIAHRFDKRARRLLATLAVLVAGAIAAFALASAPALAQSSEDVQVQARDFFGTIVSVDEGVIVVASDDVDVEVTVGEETDVRIPSRPEAGLGDLRVGDVVAVSLDPSGEADRIQLIPGKTRSRHVPGEVVALSESQISILTLGTSAATVTFDRGASTEVKFHQGTTELAVGDFVVIVALRDPSGELGTEALEINVTRRQIREVPDPKVEDAGANTGESQGVFEGIDDGSYFYFVHSYFPQPDDPAVVIGETDYGIRFASVVARDNVVATQFHPEKSGDNGLKLYGNFLRLARGVEAA